MGGNLILQTKFKETETGMIPEDWEVKKVNQVTDQIFSGGTPNTRKSEYWNGNISWLSSGETSNTFIFETERKITETGVKNSSTRLANAGDIVVASAGQGYTRGQVSFCMIDTYVNQSVVALRANKEIIEPRFLFYNLVSRYNELRRISDAHSSRGSLTTKLLADLNIQIPPIREQTAIAKILSDLDLKIALNRQMNSTLEAIGQALFKRWFIDFEFPNEDGKPYKSSGGEIVESKLGEVPRGWKMTNLPEVTEIIDCLHTKKPSQTSEGPVLLQVYNIGKNGVLDLQELYHVSERDYAVWTKNILVKEGDCIITNAGKVGAVGQIPCGYKFGIGRNITAIRPLKIPPTYLLEFLLSDCGRKEITKNTDQGTIFNSLNVKGIRKISILRPEDKVLTRYDGITRPLRKKIEFNNNETDFLATIRDTLLPKLMSGEIRVERK